MIASSGALASITDADVALLDDWSGALNDPSDALRSPSEVCPESDRVNSRAARTARAGVETAVVAIVATRDDVMLVP